METGDNANQFVRASNAQNEFLDHIGDRIDLQFVRCVQYVADTFDVAVKAKRFSSFNP